MADFTYSEDAGGQQIVGFRVSGEDPFTAQVTFADGTAKSGEDYVGSPQTLVFAESDWGVPHPASFFIIPDSIVEPDEQFILNWQEPNSSRAFLMEITDSDSTTLTVSDVQVTEGPLAAANFTLTLSNPVSEPVTISYTTEDRSAIGGALLGDFSQTVSTIIIPAMQTQATISIPLVDDLLPENLEEFALRITSISAPEIDGSKLIIGTPTALAMITDNDPPVIDPENPDEPDVPPDVPEAPEEMSWEEMLAEGKLITTSSKENPRANELDRLQTLDDLDKLPPELRDKLDETYAVWQEHVGGPLPISDIGREPGTGQHPKFQAMDLDTPETLTYQQRTDLIEALREIFPVGDYRIYYNDGATKEQENRPIPGTDLKKNGNFEPNHYNHVHIDTLDSANPIIAPHPIIPDGFFF